MIVQAPQHRYSVKRFSWKQPLNGSKEYTSTQGLQRRRRDRLTRAPAPGIVEQERTLWALLLMVALAAGIATGCGSESVTPRPATPTSGAATPSVPQPAGLTAAVVTEGCGAASAALGSAIRLDDNLFLTAAHVVIGADRVSIVPADALPVDRTWPALSPTTLMGEASDVTVLALDTELDLALLELSMTAEHASRGPRPTITTVAADAGVHIHTVTQLDPLEATVEERTTIVTDEVRGTARVRRDGYRLAARTGRGDSGAGVWSADGKLVGVVFAVSTDNDLRTWAVSGTEINRFLDRAETASQAYAAGPLFQCDPSRSRLVAGP